jgi:hypothetical protein
VKRIPKDAVVAEKTVQAAAVRLDPVKPKRKRGPSKGSRSSAVNHTRVVPEVWQAALALCGGNPRRIEVIATDSVVVHNHPRR